MSIPDKYHINANLHVYSVFFDTEQPTENSASNSTIYASENAVTPSYKEKLGDSDSIATEEVEEHSSISTVDVVTSVTSSKPVVKKTDLRKIVKVPVSCTSTLVLGHYLDFFIDLNNTTVL
jgi:hypothetical protein